MAGRIRRGEGTGPVVIPGLARLQRLGDGSTYKTVGWLITEEARQSGWDVLFNRYTNFQPTLLTKQSPVFVFVFVFVFVIGSKRRSGWVGFALQQIQGFSAHSADKT